MIKNFKFWTLFNTTVIIYPVTLNNAIIDKLQLTPQIIIMYIKIDQNFRFWAGSYLAKISKNGTF